MSRYLFGSGGLEPMSAGMLRRERGSTAGIVLLMLAVAALTCVGVGLYLRTVSSREAARQAKAREQAAQRAREQVAQQVEQELWRARQLLYRATEERLFPSREEWTRAESIYRQAIRLDPAASAPAAGTRLIRGVWRALQGDDARVEAMLRSIDAGDEEILARYVLGWFLLRQDRTLESWGQFQMILKSRPGWLPARLGKAWADVESGDYEYACPVLEEALGAWPERVELVAAYARCLDLRTGPNASLGWFARAYEMGARSSDVVEGFVTLKLNEGQAGSAHEALVALIRAEPGRADLRVLRARALEALERVPEAVAAYRVALELEPMNVETHNALGALHLYSGESEQAVACFEAARRLAPSDADTHVYLAYAHRQLGRESEADTCLLQACRNGSLFGCREACLGGQEAACRRLPSAVQREVKAELRERSRREQKLRAEASYASRRSSARRRSSSPPRPQKGRIYVVRDRSGGSHPSGSSTRSSSTLSAPWIR